MLSDAAFKEGSLCVVGNINRDLKAAPIPADERLFQDGETSVPWIVETIGGGGANSACAAAALGARVSFLGKAGDDGLAGRLGQTLRRHGVSALLTRAAGIATGTSLALSFTQGQRHFVSCLPASQSLCFRDLDMSALAGHQHLLRADLWFSEAMLFEGNQQLLDFARGAGLQTSIDINWDPAWGVASPSTISERKAAVRKILPLVDLAHGNVRELCAFTDSRDLDSALCALKAWGAGAVVVHYGEQGAGFFDGQELVVEPPVLARSHVNTTGTGDVLSVCLMLLHQSRFPVRERLRLANQVVSEFIEGRLALIPSLEG